MLKAESRAFIAAREPLRFEALLGQSEKLTVIGSGNGEAVRDQILCLTPDFLLLDGVLTGVDSLNLLCQLSAEMPAPPRVLYLGREKKWLALALQKGADAAALWNTKENALLQAAEETALTALPKLAEPWQTERGRIAEKYAALLGISDALKGKNYICLALSMLVCAPQLGASCTGRLYPLIASMCRTSPRAVERAIRTAVESTWLSGNLSAIQSLFGYAVDAERGKPTNAEFLSLLTGYARRELADLMAERTLKKQENG